MKKTQLLLLTLVIPLLGKAEIDFKKLAQSYLQNLNIVGEEMYVDQETEDHVLYISEFTKKDEEHPCHTGVVIEKKSGSVVLLKDDQGIELYFPYSDTFVDSVQRIYNFCAD